jgi:predicted RNase H-like HicB family nuclease
MLNSVDLSINLQAVLRKDEDVWVAWCPSLDIASQGETLDAAVQSLEVAVEGWFESCLERGVLKEALKEAGFVLSKDGMPVGVVFAVREENSEERPIQVRLPAYMAAELLAPNHAAH